MVHGDDNSSLPQMAFVSRYPWCFGVLVFACLLTLSGHGGHQANLTSALVLEAGPLAAPLTDFSEGSAPVLACFEDDAHQPKSFRAAMFRRVLPRSGKQREALSKAYPGGPISAEGAGIETRHRSARLTGHQRLRGSFSRGPLREDGRQPFVAWEGFPPTIRFA